MVDISEYDLYKISSELDDLKNKKVKIDELQAFSFLASVQDENRISQIIKKYKPDTVYHAAA